MIGVLDLTEASTPTLRALDELVGSALRDQIREGVSAAAAMIASGGEPFGWHFLDFAGVELPWGIRSGAVFVLPAGSRPDAHRHPNSVQHMRVLSGSARLTLSGKDGPASDEVIDVGDRRVWVVIATDVVHGFAVAETGDLEVVSFHTVPANEIVEVSSEGERRYE